MDDFDEIDDFDAAEVTADAAIREMAEKAAAATPSPAAEIDADAAQDAVPELKALPGKTRQTYEMEMIAASAAMVYIVMFLWGSRRNKAIAEEFLDTMRPWLAKQFAEVGVSGDEGSQMTKVSANEYRIFSTGRRNCEGMLVTLQLAPRQDLIALLVSIAVPSWWADAVLVEFPLSDMQPFVFAALPARTSKAEHRDTPDLRDLAAVVAKPTGITGVKAKPSQLSSFTMVTDCPEVLGSLLTSRVVQAMEQHGPVPPPAARKEDKSAAKRSGLLQSVYVSDSALMAPVESIALSNFMMRFKMKLPAPGTKAVGSEDRTMNYAQSISLLKPLFEAACHMVDTVSRVRLSKKAMGNSRSLRKELMASQDADAEAERAEFAREAKEAAARAEHERLLNMKDQTKAQKIMAKKRKKEMAGKKGTVRMVKA